MTSTRTTPYSFLARALTIGLAACGAATKALSAETSPQDLIAARVPGTCERRDLAYYLNPPITTFAKHRTIIAELELMLTDASEGILEEAEELRQTMGYDSLVLKTHVPEALGEPFYKHPDGRQINYVPRHPVNFPEPAFASISCAVAVQRAGTTEAIDVLLVKGHRRPWSIIAGYAKPHETPVDCAVREAEEEGGVAVSLHSARFLGTFQKPGGFGTPDTWTAVVMNATAPHAPLVAQAEEIGSVAWFPLSEARQLVTWPFMQRTLETLANGRSLGIEYEAATETKRSTMMVVP